MRSQMDSFHQAVEDARRQLIRDEGRNVSVRELIRRAGFEESRRSTVSRHLEVNRVWPKGHRVPPEIVSALAAVLPISEADLMKAAQQAAGYHVPAAEDRNLGYDVARFLGDAEVTPDEKARLRAELLRILADDMNRDDTVRRSGSDVRHAE